MSLTLFVDDTCPKCRKPIKLSVIDVHPDRPDLAIHNFACVDCGQVKAKVYALKPGGAAPELAA
jgi:hypothetical protein